jgi:hypothetical protein
MAFSVHPDSEADIQHNNYSHRHQINTDFSDKLNWQCTMWDPMDGRSCQVMMFQSSITSTTLFRQLQLSMKWLMHLQLEKSHANLYEKLRRVWMIFHASFCMLLWTKMCLFGNGSALLFCLAMVLACFPCYSVP